MSQCGVSVGIDAAHEIRVGAAAAALPSGRSPEFISAVKGHLSLLPSPAGAC